MQRKLNIAVLSATFILLALLLGACSAEPAEQAAPPAPAPTESSGEAAEAPASPTEAAAEEPAETEDVGTFTYWGGLIFSEEANDMLVARITEWGELRGVDTEVVMINQNETIQRVSAAIEAGTMPDALDMGWAQMLLLSGQDQLQPVDDLYDEIGDSLGGWLNAAEQATDPDLFDGNRYGIPFSLGGNVLYRRADILEPLGFTEAPATWEEVADMSRAAQDPPNYYGMAFALSDVGDANLTQSMLRSWGGRIADDAGENCTIDSAETRAFLEWITQAWDDGQFPPGVTTYDGAGDNVAYQSGTAIFIANPGSVFLYMRNEDPDLGAGTKYSGLPGGPVMRVSPVGANLRVIPKSTNAAKTELAKDLYKFLAEPEFMNEYYFNAIYGPAAEGYRDAPIFSESAVHEGLLDLAVNGTFGSFPDQDNAALAEYDTNFLTPRMIQRIVVDGLSIDDSIAETQAACQEIYDKYKDDAPAAAAEVELPTDVGTFTYWGGLIFSEEANDMLVARIEEWGELRGIDTEVVMINQNETVQRVSAAIEAGTMPDALDMGWAQMLLLSGQDQLQPVDDLYDEIGQSLGGWLNAAEQATDPDLFDGNRYGIPFSLGGNVLYRRADILDPLGFTEAPATWEEVADMSRAAQDPPNYYGMAFALSDVGDANLTQSMLRSWGGRIADDAGENCTIDSAETRAFLEWITQAWDDGQFPPGVTTYDGAGDNVAYQSGTAIFIANPGSVFLYMRNEDPDLGAGTKYSGLPGGPVMRVSPVNANMRVIPISTDADKTILAKDLYKFLAEPEFMNDYYFNAIYGPAAEGYRDAPIFSESAVHEGLLDLAVNGTFGSFPDQDNAALAEYDTNFLTPRMIQRIVVDGLSIDDSIAETQAACQEIYDKYN